MSLAYQLADLRKAATPGPWAENGTLLLGNQIESDASTTENPPVSWVSFKTLRSAADRALFIFLTDHASEIESALRAQEERGGLEGLVCSLWLYVGHHAETQLTTEQKVLLYDTLDSQAEPGTPPHTRWWLAPSPEEGNQ